MLQERVAHPVRLVPQVVSAYHRYREGPDVRDVPGERPALPEPPRQLQRHRVVVPRVPALPPASRHPPLEEDVAVVRVVVEVPRAHDRPGVRRLSERVEAGALLQVLEGPRRVRRLPHLVRVHEDVPRGCECLVEESLQGSVHEGPFEVQKLEEGLAEVVAKDLEALQPYRGKVLPEQQQFRGSDLLLLNHVDPALVSLDTGGGPPPTPPASCGSHFNWSGHISYGTFAR